MVWRGDLVTQGGGFCGTRIRPVSPMDLTCYDGLTFRVKGDGSRFKINIKSQDMMERPEQTYQATFDTVPNVFVDIFIPWRQFVPVRKTMTDRSIPSLEESLLSHPETSSPLASVASVALVYSRFQFNKQPNPKYKPGPFTLELEGGMRGYLEDRVQVVLLSAGAVERNAVIHEDQEARVKDIPIVRLNPGGALNWKYKGEMALRESGLRYTVVRSTGMTRDDEDELDGPYVIEAGQGDVISGAISRPELAQVIGSALRAASAGWKTVEVRRSEAKSDRGKGMKDADWTRLWLKTVTDYDRHLEGIPPLPIPTDVPAPLSPELVQKTFAEQQVQTSVAKGRGGRVREVQDGERLSSRSLLASTDNSGSDGEADARVDGAVAAAAVKNKQEQLKKKSTDASTSNAEVRAWIANWRAAGSSTKANSASNGASTSNAEVRAWIANWRGKA